MSKEKERHYIWLSIFPVLAGILTIIGIYFLSKIDNRESVDE